jgi:hypothetical protein
MDVKNNSLQDTLSNLIPKSLDDIIRANRDQGRLSLASTAEFKALAVDLEAGCVRHTLSHWQIVVLHITMAGEIESSPLLVGRVLRTGQSWMTSHVRGIDLKRGLVKTANSLYRLEGERVGEEELDLIHICATLNYWGIGQHFGVPRFFY